MFNTYGDVYYWHAMVIDGNFIEQADRQTLGEAIVWANDTLKSHEGREGIEKLAPQLAREEDGNIQYGKGDLYVIFLQTEGQPPR